MFSSIPSVGPSAIPGGVSPAAPVDPSALNRSTTVATTGGGSLQRSQGSVAPLTPAERQRVSEEKNQWGMDSSNQLGKDLNRLALLNRVIGNSSSYKAFPGASNGNYASNLRTDLLDASRMRDDALRVINDSGQTQRPFTPFGLGSSPLSQAWTNLDRANAWLESTRAETDKFLDNGSSRRFYLEPTVPKQS